MAYDSFGVDPNGNPAPGLQNPAGAGPASQPWANSAQTAAEAQGSCPAGQIWDGASSRCVQPPQGGGGQQTPASGPQGQGGLAGLTAPPSGGQAPAPLVTGAPPPNWQPTAQPGAQAPTYQPFQYAALPGAPKSSLTAPTEDLMQKMLAGTSMSPEVVAQMKEGQKGTALDMANQLRQQMTQSAAGRGVAGGGGLASNLAQLDMSTLGNISSQYRNTDIQKAMQDRIDQQNAVAQSNQYQQQLMQSYLANQGLSLQQQGAQAGEQFKGFQSQQSAQQTNFNQWLEGQGLKEQASKDAFQNWATTKGIDIANLQSNQQVAQQVFQQWQAEQGITLAGNAQTMQQDQNKFSNWATTQGINETQKQDAFRNQQEDSNAKFQAWLSGENLGLAKKSESFGESQGLFSDTMQAKGFDLTREQAKNAEDQRQYSNEANAKQQQFQNWLAQQSVQAGAAAAGAQQQVQQAGQANTDRYFGLDEQALAERKRQFDLTNQLSMASFLGGGA